MRKIWLVEDDENIRDLVSYALASAGFETVGFESGEELFKELGARAPHLILLDIMLPGEDGLAVLKMIRQNPLAKKTPVIMLTAKGSEWDRVKGLDLGADDYMVKPFSILELISRVNAVLRRLGDGGVSENLLTYKEISMDVQKHSVSAGEHPVGLTFKEFELLQFLIYNQGIVLSREKIMDQVWGNDFMGESRTVDMHVKNLRQKLGTAGVHIKTVRGIGYKIGD
ncbi:MAG: response regulator transcription factor [Peptococcaceae bacterium]|jgi:two-component system alkaline phosphatase synthesis response regulator PhoP|nr:response regulator transcription factor [Peptococcaceae bacterium]